MQNQTENPGGSRDREKNDESAPRENRRNHDNEKQGIIPDAERVEKDSEGKFSPGEAPDYNGDEFSTD